MITPPLSISARPALVRNVASSRICPMIRAGSVPPRPTRRSAGRRHGEDRAEPYAGVVKRAPRSPAVQDAAVRRGDEQLAGRGRRERVGHRLVGQVEPAPAVAVPVVEAPAGALAGVGGARAAGGRDEPAVGVAGVDARAPSSSRGRARRRAPPTSRRRRGSARRRRPRPGTRGPAPSDATRAGGRRAWPRADGRENVAPPSSERITPPSSMPTSSRPASCGSGAIQRTWCVHGRGGKLQLGLDGMSWSASSSVHAPAVAGDEQPARLGAGVERAVGGADRDREDVALGGGVDRRPCAPAVRGSGRAPRRRGVPDEHARRRRWRRTRAGVPASTGSTAVHDVAVASRQRRRTSRTRVGSRDAERTTSVCASHAPRRRERARLRAPTAYFSRNALIRSAYCSASRL